MVAALKAAVGQLTGGSNPSPSARAPKGSIFIAGNFRITPEQKADRGARCRKGQMPEGQMPEGQMENVLTQNVQKTMDQIQNVQENVPKTMGRMQNVQKNVPKRRV